MAADALGILEKDLKKLIKFDDRRLKQDRNQRQNYPFNSFQYVYVASQGGDAGKDMSISLTEWLSLCSLLHDKPDGVSFGKEEKIIYYRYTGSRRINLAAMKESNRFISPAALATKDVAHKRSRAESHAREHKGLPVKPQSGVTTNTKPMQIIRECSIGLASSRVANHQNREYCLERWDHCRGAWRSKKCLLSTGNEHEALDPKLWNQSNLLQCMKCSNSFGNISFRRNAELFDDGADEISSVEDLAGKVVDTYWQLDKEGDNKTIKNDQVVVESMIILQSRGISSIDCDKGIKILICPGVDDMMGKCQRIEVVRAQTNNSECCKECQNLKKQIHRRECQRNENKERRIDPTSKVNVTKLRPDELKERTKRMNVQRKVARRANAKLKKAFEVEIDHPGDPTGIKTEESDDEFPKQHLKFMEEIKHATTYASASTRREEFKKAIESTLIDVLKEGVMSEQKDTAINFQKEDVADLVKLIVEQMDNTVQKLSGKSGRIRHSPLSYQIAWTQYKRSKAGFRETKLYSPLLMPNERELGRLKSVSKIEDGNDATLYEVRLRTKKERAAGKSIGSNLLSTAARLGPTMPQYFDPKIVEHGVLMVDEMKVKHGMVFNSSTLEPVGMANDDLDLKTVMQSVLRGSGDHAKPAVYVSQWRYKDFVSNEAWNCSYYFNDGSCTGETLLRQLSSVVLSCESIGSKVFGICMDAGGNNARLMRIARNDRTLTSIDDSWINDNLCYIRNEYNSNRRIYMYFCLTHQLKAMRNQLLASLPNGAKAFKDKNGISFGFALIQKVQKNIEQLDADVAFKPRITENVAYPSKYSKMSVTDAKKPFELLTLTYLESYFCSEMGINKTDLDVDGSSLIVKYIQEDGSGSPALRHGRMYYRAKLLMDIALSRRKNNSISADLLSDIATYIYLSAVGAIFNGMLSDTKERFNKKNITDYTNFLKDVMSYFSEWKMAQLNRKEQKHADWKESFLDGITYNNLRSAVCGFVHFSTYILEHILTYREAKLYIPMMFGNQTSLEGFFSVMRGGNFDTAVNYGSNINNDATTSAIAAMNKSSYDASDMGLETGGGVISGMTAYATYHRKRNDEVNRWKESWQYRKNAGTSCRRFPLAMSNIITFMSTHSKKIISRMEGVLVPNHHAVTLFESKRFENWKRLSIGTPHESYFNKIVNIADAELDPVCQHIHLKLLECINTSISKSTASTESSFESQLRNYLISIDFDTLCTAKLPSAIRNDRFGAIILVRCLAEIHESWFYHALRQSCPRPPSSAGVMNSRTLTCEQVNQLVHRFVGAAIRACLTKFRKNSAVNRYGKEASIHAKTILQSMRLASLSDALSDNDYMEHYYPKCIQHFNQGGLSLLKKELFPWGTALIQTVWLSLTESVISTYKKESIKQAAATVYNNGNILIEFISNIRSAGCAITVSDEALNVVHSALVKFVFLAYAGMRWDNQFGDPKKKRGSKHNVSHRTNLQCMTTESKRENNQVCGKKRQPPSKDMVSQFEQNIGGAMKRLRSNGKTKLSKIEMSSVLYICYDEYASINRMDSNQLKAALDRAMQGDMSKLEKAGNSSAPAEMMDGEEEGAETLEYHENVESKLSFEEALAQMPMPQKEL